jgi:hypothetical protein
VQVVDEDRQHQERGDLEDEGGDGHRDDRDPGEHREEERPDQDIQQAQHDRREQQRDEDPRAGGETDARHERDHTAQREDADDERGQQAADARGAARLPRPHDLDLEPVEVDHPAHQFSLPVSRSCAVVPRQSMPANRGYRTNRAISGHSGSPQ